MKKLFLLLALVLVGSHPSFAVGFTHTQNGCNHDEGPGGSLTTAACVFTNNPATGDVVVCGVIWYDGTVNTNLPGTISVADGAGSPNSYTKSPNSPEATVNAGPTYLYYYLAGATANKTITATFSSTGTLGYAGIWCDDIVVTGGTAAFDLDVFATSAGPSTAISTPTITVGGTGELLYSICNPGNTVTSVNGVWTLGGNAIGAITGVATGYDLSASSNTAINCTQSPAGGWNGGGMAFTFTASGGATTPQRRMLTLGTGD